MRVEEMRRLLDAHDLAAARHDAEAVAATFAEDGVYENFSLGLRFEGRDAVQLHYAGSYRMTPDMRINHLAEIAGYDVVAKMSIVSGTVREHFIGVPAQGQVEFPFLTVFRFGAELLSHVGVYYDLDVLCRQLQISPDEVRLNLEALRQALVGGSASAESARWRQLFRRGGEPRDEQVSPTGRAAGT